MTVYLWVLRHAKAEDTSPGGDITRRLTKSGRRQAELVRDHVESLAGSQPLPELVLCSTAARARETAEPVMEALPKARIEFDKNLYSMDTEEIVDWIRSMNPDEHCLMVVGHNPTLYELCVLLAEPKDKETFEDDGLSKGALVGLSATASSWADARKGAFSLAHRFVPRLK
jgi:phosphohistidine phosphatase